MLSYIYGFIYLINTISNDKERNKYLELVNKYNTLYKELVDIAASFDTDSSSKKNKGDVTA